MSGSVSWSGGSGDWSFAGNWNPTRVPGAGDAVTLDTTASTVTLDTAGAAAALSLLAGTFDLVDQLTLGGLLMVAGGTLVLAGTLTGGTLDLAAADAMRPAGGTLDGVLVSGGLADLGGFSITAATAAVNAAAPIAPAGTLTLDAGVYADATFLLDPQLLRPSPGGIAELDAASGATVTLAAAGTITLSDDPVSGFSTLDPMPGDAVALGGGGNFVNLGLVSSDFSNAGGGGLAITAAGFTNDAAMIFTPMTSTVSATVPTGRLGRTGGYAYSTLTWTQAFAPTLDIAAARFVNAGTLGLSGGTVAVSSAVFDNSGAILLSDVPTQVLQNNGGLYSVGSATLASEILVGGSVGDFANTGTIAADTIEFDASIALAALGTVQGALVFTGTLDLGGGTLDASAYGTVTISGTVRDGTIAAGSGTLALDGATLDAVAIAPGGNVPATGAITLIDPPTATTAITLDATTTELAFATVSTVATLAITAGAVGVTDTLALPGSGTVTFGAGVSLAAAVAGSTVDLTGGGVLVIDGRIGVDAAVLDIAPTLDGSGTIGIAGGAHVTLDAVAATAALTVVFDAGSGLVVLPGNGAGVTIDGLQPGDLVDFRAVSPTPDGLFGTGGVAISGGMLDVTGASGDTASVPVTDAASGLTLSIGNDDLGGSLVTAACFRAGTSIATPRGEIAVERLAIGDLVLTADGPPAPVKWLGRRRYPAARVAASPELRPVRIAAGALAPGVPHRMLEVSPEHALLADGVLIPAGALVNAVSITRADDAGDVVYVHVELATHALILAEGAAAETFIPLAGRALFDNAAEFAALYPGADHRVGCAMPRVDCGPAVAQARAMVAARAGIAPAAAPLGALRGHVERIAAGIVEGWACDDAAADPLAFDMRIGGVAAGRVLANRYRIDLDHHGLPACGFRIAAPEGAAITLHRAGDGAALPFG